MQSKAYLWILRNISQNFVFILNINVKSSWNFLFWKKHQMAVTIYKAIINVCLFADDVKVYVQIVSSHDVYKLQNALDMITSWAQTWQLTVSVNKCCILSIGSAVTSNWFLYWWSNIVSSTVLSWPRCYYFTWLKTSRTHSTDGYKSTSMCKCHIT